MIDVHVGKTESRDLTTPGIIVSHMNPANWLDVITLQADHVMLNFSGLVAGEIIIISRRKNEH